MRLLVLSVMLGAVVAVSCRRKPAESSEITKPPGEGPGQSAEDFARTETTHSPVEGKLDLSKRRLKSALPDIPQGGDPYARKVPDKDGLVFSPFAEGKMIDVEGYPTGTLVKCPYTGKEFLAP